MLAPLFQGEWASYGESLDCAAQWPAEAVSVSCLANDDALLGNAIRHYATRLGVSGNDLRPAASAWSLDYLWALLPPMVAAASVLQHCFPMCADDVGLSLNDFGAPVRFHVRHEGRAMPGTSSLVRYGPLLEAHLDPLFLAIFRQTGLAQKILWGNTARYLEAILDQALALAGNANHIVADRQALLQQTITADGRLNPLYGRQRTSAHAKDGVTLLHRQCCLYYRLPGQSYCGACPLAPRHRQR